MFVDNKTNQKSNEKDVINDLSKIDGIEIYRTTDERGEDTYLFTLSEGADGKRNIEIVVSKQGEPLFISYEDKNNERIQAASYIFSQPEQLIEEIERIIGHDLQTRQDDSSGSLSVGDIDLDKVRQAEQGGNWWD